MVSSFYSRAEEICQGTNNSDLRKISDQQLVRLCLENDRPAWEEFFRRFIPTIKNAIKEKLGLSGRPNLCFDEEVLWNIHEKIVVKLYNKGILRQCAKPSGLRSWLKTIAHNQTTDWLKEQGRKKRLPQRAAECSTLSLFAPLKRNPDLTLEATLADKSESDEELRTYLDKILKDMDQIEDEKKYWILRLSIVAHLPLLQEELAKLATYSGHSESTLKSHFEKIMPKLEAKEQQRLVALGKAVLMWHEIRRLEYKLVEMGKDLSKETEIKIKRIETEIEKKNKRREDLLKKGGRLSKPSNRDIAKIVGLPENKVAQVSNILIRARSVLQEKLGKAFTV